jgi:hypothetical protein
MEHLQVGIKLGNITNTNTALNEREHARSPLERPATQKSMGCGYSYVNQPHGSMNGRPEEDP